MRYIFSIVLSGLTFLILAVPALAEHDQIFDTFTLYYENDYFQGTDHNYTSGLKLTWSSPYASDVTAAELPYWIYPLMAHLPWVGESAQRRAISLSIGQAIYTPSDKKTDELVVDDRPYAGITYLGFGIHEKTERRRNTWELNVGLLGPASGADKVQGVIHDLKAVGRPKGWDHQLQNEITVDAVFETQWKLKSLVGSQNFSYDFIPHLGGRVGTVNIYANAGGEFRFGWRMPNDFGSCPIRVGCEVSSAFVHKHSDYGRLKRFGLHFFVAADGRLVLRDIYLDGNTFRDSHSVDKEPLVADLIAGVSLHYGKLKVIYSNIYRTRQFEAQAKGQSFSSLSLSWMF